MRSNKFQPYDRADGSSSEEVIDLDFARDRKRGRDAEREAESTSLQTEKKTLETSWSSSEDSLDDPVYDMEGETSLDFDAHDNVLGLQTEQDLPQQDN